MIVVRIISGIAKGRSLQTLPGNHVRPTTDKVKEAIFSSIQFDIEGRRFLDLFAGSGQMGLEALSRGAQSATFVDSSADSLKICRQNIDTVGFSAVSKTVHSDALLFLNRNNEKFDIAFLDPPYAADLLEKALLLLAKQMSDFGTIICEHPTDIILPERVDDFSLCKTRKYGKINVTFYKKEII